MWQKNSGAAFHEGPGAPIDLRTMVGLPGRILFADAAHTQRLEDLPCTVKKVTAKHLIVEPAPTTALPGPGSAVILEVSQQTALVQCFTTVRNTGPGNHLTLNTPGRPHVLQRRRFHRVDLFLSISISTAERLIDQLPAQMINLSAEGAACVLAEPVSPGASLSLNLTAIGLHPPEAVAVVVRCTPTPSHLWVIGLRFLALEPEQELYLGKYTADVARLQSLSQ